MLTKQRFIDGDYGINISVISNQGQEETILVSKTENKCFTGEIQGYGEKGQFDVDDIGSVDEKLYFLEVLTDFDNELN